MLCLNAALPNSSSRFTKARFDVGKYLKQLSGTYCTLLLFSTNELDGVGVEMSALQPMVAR